MSARAIATAAWAAALTLVGPGCERLPTAPAAPFRLATRGFTFVDWSADGYQSVTASAALDALAATGANTATVLVTAYQTDPTRGDVSAADPRTPTPSALRETLAAAAALGLKTALKPHVDLNDGDWRGHIEPENPEAWFDSYRSFILPLAALAESAGVTQFVVGTELAGTVRHERQWRETIRAVRRVFSGEVIYAASWDEAASVPFWSDLDLVGVDFYFPVATRPDAGRLELLAGWQPWLDRLHRLHRQTGRRILLTEVGYRSVDGAGMRPYRFDTDEALDLGEQADLYWATLQAIGNRGWIAGLYWWNWPADGSGGAANRDFTPRDKPAAEEIRGAWRSS